MQRKRTIQGIEACDVWPRREKFDLLPPQPQPVWHPLVLLGQSKNGSN